MNWTFQTPEPNHGIHRTKNVKQGSLSYALKQHIQLLCTMLYAMHLTEQLLRENSSHLLVSKHNLMDRVFAAFEIWRGGEMLVV